MLRPLKRTEAREIDEIAIQQFEMSGLVLMENAGRGAAEKIQAIAPVGDVLIVSGKGNNGGDGFVIARHLQRFGRTVQILSLCPLTDLSGDAAANARIAKHGEIPIRELDSTQDWHALVEDADVLVDCMLGTGARGALKSPYDQICSLCNAQSTIRIAIDIPTGLDCDTGACDPNVFAADHTLTFVSTKVGFLASSAKRIVGQIHVVGIGVPQKLLARYQAS